ncbi:TonB-dependent receptor [Chitinophaga caseinilytica]|uniref:TonB-dependent receptor n=1 Tax=Chitinophaga caseinilytica TaxID=2267521 RepID=A0ABZ2Z518_9BACT
MFKKILFVFCCMLACSAGLYAQEKFTVEGQVLDSASNEPFPGATVVVKNMPSLGTVTDGKGQFKLSVAKYDIILVTAMGFAEKEYRITGGGRVLIKLSQKLSDVDEVVVVGYATQKKATMVGAVTTVPVSALRTPTASLVNGLAGNAAGVIAMQRTGEPGRNASQFWIRGIGTFGANQSALVLVDGIERGSINEIDPDDIESFSILKDASATAVYGVRGANGVVLINTKRGKAGKPSINFRVERGTLQPSRLQNYVGAYDYARLANEAREVRGMNPVYNREEMEIIKYGLDPDIYPDVDWRALTIKDHTSNLMARASIGGGGNTARYYLSGSYYNEEGLYKFDNLNNYNSNVNYKKYTFRSNVDVDVTPTMLINIGVGGNIAQQNRPGIASDFIWGSMGTLTPLTVPLQYSSGQMASYGMNNQANPYVLLTKTGFITDWQNTIESSLKLTQELPFITPGLKVHILYSFDSYNVHNINRVKFPELYLAQRQRDPETGALMLQKKTESTPMSFSKLAYGTRSQYLEAALNYYRVFNKDHSVSGLLLFNRRDKVDNQAVTDVTSIPYRAMGTSGRVTYGYKSRYLMEANFGYNGSENFEIGNQYGFFPSIAAGWVLSEEPFIKKILPDLRQLKLRASYGLVGNDQIGGGKRFPYMTFVNTGAPGYSFGDYGNNYFPGIREGELGADNLGWEVDHKLNFGVDFNWADRVTVQADLFRSKRTGIFMLRTTLPDVVGNTTAPWGNVGAMKNAGFDMSASYTHQFNKTIVTLRGNFTYTHNEILEYDEPKPRFPYQGLKGFPYGQLKGYKALGLFKDSADIMSSPVQTFGEVRPGDIKYRDVNGDGLINDDDKVPIGTSTVPQVVYGFGAEVRYGDFDLAFRFQGASKSDFFYAGYGMFPFVGGETGNVLDIVNDPANRWTPDWYSGGGKGSPSTENPDARFPRMTYGNSTNNSQASTFWLANAKYIRLKEMQIGYTVPPSWLRRLKVKTLRVYATGFNLLVWDNVKLWDPELAGSGGLAYPIQKTVSFGIDLRF